MGPKIERPGMQSLRRFENCTSHVHNAPRVTKTVGASYIHDERNTGDNNLHTLQGTCKQQPIKAWRSAQDLMGWTRGRLRTRRPPHKWSTICGKGQPGSRILWPWMLHQKIPLQARVEHPQLVGMHVAASHRGTGPSGAALLEFKVVGVLLTSYLRGATST